MKKKFNFLGVSYMRIEYFIVLVIAVCLLACGETGKKKNETVTETTPNCTVDISGNFIFSNITGNIYLDVSACSKANSGDCKGACDTELNACIETGETTGFVESDEECQVLYDDCITNC